MGVVILYHANCPDGWSAAWAAHRKYGDAAQYIPVSHGEEPPVMEPGSDVLIVDFSFPRATLQVLAEQHHVHVEDHHATAQADLDGLDFCHFDMDQSGAMLTWKQLFPDEKPPQLIRYIQDRDLWRWELPNSREVSAWLSSWPFDFGLWDALSLQMEHDETLAVFASEGAALLRLKQQYVESMARHPSFVEIGGYTVPAVNATVCFSEVADLLCERYPEAKFAAYWIDRSDNRRQWGLRSRNGFDVSVVAKALGGGGHRAASGFVEDMEPIRTAAAP